MNDQGLRRNTDEGSSELAINEKMQEKIVKRLKVTKQHYQNEHKPNIGNGAAFGTSMAIIRREILNVRRNRTPTHLSQDDLSHSGGVRL